ncbi:MAG: nitrogenase component 1, partial [Desulfovibrionaceae bacterium]
SGAHMDGFHGAVRAVCAQMARDEGEPGGVNLLGGFASCGDIRWYRRLLAGFGLDGTVLPDHSLTLDGISLPEYRSIPDGGTALADIRAMGSAAATIELGRAVAEKLSGALVLQDRFGVPAVRLGLPVGLRETDRFMDELERISGQKAPEEERLARGRLVDAYVDGHKYLFGKRAVVYGEEDLVIALCAFLAETGVQPVLAATGQKSGRFQAEIRAVTDGLVREEVAAVPGADFHDIAELAESLAPDLLVGHSKGYRYAREWGVPLVRAGFPIHDRFGGQRLRHMGYRGTQELFDRIVNAVIEYKQSRNDVGYGYI